jgi:hypothetical protein
MMVLRQHGVTFQGEHPPIPVGTLTSAIQPYPLRSSKITDMAFVTAMTRPIVMDRRHLRPATEVLRELHLLGECV